MGVSEMKRRRERAFLLFIGRISMHDATRQPRDLTGRPIPYAHGCLPYTYPRSPLTKLERTPQSTWPIRDQERTGYTYGRARGRADNLIPGLTKMDFLRHGGMSWGDITSQTGSPIENCDDTL